MRNSTRWESILKFVLIIAILTVIGSVIILALVPPVSRDALTHHLAVPKLYLKHGGIYEIPAIVFSYYPMNLDFLYLAALYFGNDIVPKFIHFIFALLCAWLVFSHLKRRLNSFWALLGMLFYLSLPIIVKLSITVYVDLGLVFFSTATIIGLFRWIENRFKIQYLLLAAFCCGLALGTKYNGLIVLFLLSAVVPIVFLKSSGHAVKTDAFTSRSAKYSIQLKAAGYGAIFCLTALLVFSPWMIRNYIWRGNPIYPLYQSVFNPPRAIPAEAKGAVRGADQNDTRKIPAIRKSHSKWSSIALRSVVYHESWWEIALIPVRIFFQGQDDSPKHFDGKLNPYLFLLPFCAFIQLKRNPATLRIEKIILAAFIVLYIVYAFLQTDMRIRYIAPIIPPTVMLSVFGLHNLACGITNRWGNLPRRIAPGLVLMLAGALLTYNGIYIYQQFKHVNPFSYLSGQVSRDEYIVKYRPEYLVIQHVNQHLPDSAKILGLYLGNRGYYFDREILFGNGLFQKIVKKGNSPVYIKENLQKLGFTHLIIRYDLFNRWAEKQLVSGEKERVVKFFEKYLFKLYSQAGYGLFQFHDHETSQDVRRIK